MCHQCEQKEEELENLKKELHPHSFYDESFGDGKKCSCGHDYYRHFDSWDRMAPIGCKHCGCSEFKNNDIQTSNQSEPDKEGDSSPNEVSGENAG